MATHAHHGVGHGRKKKKSILRQLQSSSMNALMPNTYSRRMTRYSAYDADTVTFRGDGMVDQETEKNQEMEDKENLFLESLLTKIHDITSKFVLVNTEHSDFPIVYVSDEFLSFWRYSRKQIFLKDGRLPMMVGESTDPSFLRNLESTMNEEEADHFQEYTLYKEGHQKTVSVIVSVLTLPKHSKARYVLVATEELNDADTFGVDLHTKKGGAFSNLFNSFKQDKTHDINDDDYVPGLIRNAETIRKDFEKENGSLFLVIHDNAPKQLWDWVLLYTVIWTIFIIPLQLAFRMPCTALSDCAENTDSDTTAKGQLFEQEWIISLICDVLFMVDVFLSCITTYINNDGVVISEIPHIFGHYIRTWFIVDFIAAIPWEFIILISGVHDDSFLHLLKAMAIIRVLRVFRRVHDYMSSGVMSFVFMMFTFTIFAHFIACGWFAIGKLNIPHKDGWLYKFVELSQAPQGVIDDTFESPFSKYDVVKNTFEGGLTGQEVYLASLYFSFTSLTTVGFGNAAPQVHFERVYSIVIMVVGSLMYASIFGYVASIIHRISQQTSELNKRQTELVDFINVHHFPESLSNRMVDFFYNYWFTTKGVVAREIMEGWPKALREDCYLYIHDLLLKRWPVLKEASIGCQRALSERLDRIIQCPGDTIYHAGDCVGEIYFVVRGHIKVMKNDRLIGILTSGDIFGENFWPTRTGRKSKADVQALTYCEFEVLTHKNLNEILIQFPDYWDIWTEKLKISYELSAKGNLFTEDTPKDFKRFVQDARTTADGEIIEKIEETCRVKDPKAYYFGVNKQRSDMSANSTLNAETRKVLQEMSRIADIAESSKMNIAS